MRKLMGCIAAFITIVAILTACSSTTEAPAQAWYQEESTVLGETVALSAKGSEAVAVIEESLVRLRSLEALFDLHDPSSDIGRLNAAAGQDYVTLSEETYHVLAVALEYSEIGQGAWDITAAPLLSLWRIADGEDREPEPDAIAAASGMVDWHHLHLRPEDSSAFLDKADMAVDLGELAKGYALDELRRIYVEHGVESGFISIGGKAVYARGFAKDNRKWRVDLPNPLDTESSLAVVPFSNVMLASAASTGLPLAIGGSMPYRSLDLSTGYPARTGAAGSNIAIKDTVDDAGLIAVILAQAVLSFEPEAGREFLRGLPIPVSGEVISADYAIYPLHGFAKLLSDVDNRFALHLD